MSWLPGTTTHPDDGAGLEGRRHRRKSRVDDMIASLRYSSGRLHRRARALASGRRIMTTLTANHSRAVGVRGGAVPFAVRINKSQNRAIRATRGRGLPRPAAPRRLRSTTSPSSGGVTSSRRRSIDSSTTGSSCPQRVERDGALAVVEARAGPGRDRVGPPARRSFSTGGRPPRRRVESASQRRNRGSVSAPKASLPQPPALLLAASDAVRVAGFARSSISGAAAHRPPCRGRQLVHAGIRRVHTRRAPSHRRSASDAAPTRSARAPRTPRWAPRRAARRRAAPHGRSSCARARSVTMERGDHRAGPRAPVGQCTAAPTSRSARAMPQALLGGVRVQIFDGRRPLPPCAKYSRDGGTWAPKPPATVVTALCRSSPARRDRPRRPPPARNTPGTTSA